MDSSQGDVESNTDVDAEKVVESLDEPKEAVDEINESTANVGNDNTGDPLYVQKRLKQQKRAHDREMREMQARMAELQAQVSPQNPQSFDANPYGETGQNQSQNIDETISKAVSFALQQREMEERKAKEREAHAQLASEYDELQRHLDHIADKYEDFEDVVRSNSAPFTATIRDAALLLPKQGPGSAGEVLYKLGKNPEELARISKLPSYKQAAEVVKLSHALASGGDQKVQSNRPLSQIKANPVTNSVGVNEKTPISSIRDRMKKGTFR